MYSERTGDMFAATDLDALAHGVNCKGVMGKGVAKVFAERYPEMKKLYVFHCEQRTLHPGDCMPWHDMGISIFNLATQDRPGPDAKLRWVAASVARMLDNVQNAPDIHRIGIPRIGCGIGGLEWVEVRMILELLALESHKELVVFSL